MFQDRRRAATWPSLVVLDVCWLAGWVLHKACIVVVVELVDILVIVVVFVVVFVLVDILVIVVFVVVFVLVDILVIVVLLCWLHPCYLCYLCPPSYRCRCYRRCCVC